MRNQRTAEKVARGRNVVAGFVPEIRQVQKRRVRDDK
jgi:hypothetical protein